MVTEDYVSFEVAKLLKEKGFNGEYHMYYIEDGKYKCDDLHDIKDYAKSIAQFNYLHNTKIPAPTLQMAMKWLREVHSLSVEVQFFLNEENDISSWNYDIIDIITYCNKARYAMCVNFETYEQAAEAALKYTLENLI